MLWGPFQAECLDAARGAGDRARFLARQLRAGRALAARATLIAGAASGCATGARSARRRLAARPSSSTSTGSGRVVFCHATPRSDEEILTRLTPDEAVAAALAGVEADVVVCGHTHVQFDRRVPGAAARQRRQRRAAVRGSTRRVLGAARTGRRAAAHRLRRRGRGSRASRTSGFPARRGDLRRVAADGRRHPSEATAYFEAHAWRVATSARRAVAGSGRDASASARSSSVWPRSTRTRRSRFASAPTSSCSSR